ncbi:MAG: CsgG/HfaB family protein [Thermodesulfobacteriota bacterium]|nr:CsgG/HfaB family protein [Thermodesulfobacteriota bacterium]
MRKIFIFFMLLAGSIVLPACSPQQHLAPPLKQEAESVASCQAYRVAVLGLKNKLNSRNNDFLWEKKVCYNAGNIVSNYIEKKIIELKKFQVVERTHVNEIIKEYELSAYGLTDNDLNIIRLLNADGVIVGEVSELYTKNQIINIGGGCDFTAKLIDIRSGKVLFSFSANEVVNWGNYKNALEKAMDKFHIQLSQFQCTQ